MLESRPGMRDGKGVSFILWINTVQMEIYVSLYHRVITQDIACLLIKLIIIIHYNLALVQIVYNYVIARKQGFEYLAYRIILRISLILESQS